MDQEIRDDYALEEEDDAEMMSAFAEIETLETDLQQLLDSTIAVERFGINPPAFLLLKQSNLLTGTAMEALNPTDFGFESKDSDVTALALEGLIERINDTAGRWSAKIIATTKSMVDKVGGLLTPLWDKVSSVGKRAAAALADTASAGVHMVKAHPYATIATLVAAAIAVVGIIAFVAGGIPFAAPGLATLTAFVGKVGGMIDKIKLPFGKIVTTLSQQGTKLTVAIVDVAQATKSASVASLGWTTSAVKAILGKLSQVGSALKTGFSSLGSKIFAGLKKVDAIGGEMGSHLQSKVKAKTGSGMLSWGTKKAVEKTYDTMLWSLVMAMFGLVRGICLKAFSATTQTLGAVASGQPDPEAA